MTAPLTTTVVLAGVVAATALAAVSTALVAAAIPPETPSCLPARPPGAVVDVRLAGGPPMPRGHLRAWPRHVPAGPVTLRAVNMGPGTHEVEVLPLRRGAWPGQRPVGRDGTVEEADALGEASAACRAGAGKGLRAGQVGWVTVSLPPGRYELVCNRPGHYAAGMFDLLVVD